MIFGQGTTLDTGQVTQLFGHVTIVLPLIFGHVPQQHYGILRSTLEYHFRIMLYIKKHGT